MKILTFVLTTISSCIFASPQVDSFLIEDLFEDTLPKFQKVETFSDEYFKELVKVIEDDLASLEEKVNAFRIIAAHRRIQFTCMD